MTKRPYYITAYQPSIAYTSFHGHFATLDAAVRKAKALATEPWRADELIEVYGPDGFEEAINAR